MGRVFIVFAVLFFASCVCGQGLPPMPGHSVYGFVEDDSGWGVVGAGVVVSSNVSGVVWEGVSGKEGYFNSGFMSVSGEGELLTVVVSWGGVSESVSRVASGARTLFSVRLPVVVERLEHDAGVRNVSVVVGDVSGLLGGVGDLTVFVENTGDFRLLAVNVSVLGVPVDWNVSGLGVLDLGVGERGSVSFVVSVPVGASVGGFDFVVRVVFDGGVVEVPVVFGVEPACSESVGCGLGFVCVGGVCEVNGLCFDGVLNQGELGVDCGGPCLACVVSTLPRPSVTTLPLITTVLKSSSSVSFVPDSCFNGVLDEGELGVDCGGLCRACGGGFSVWALLGGVGVFVLLFLILLVLAVLWLKKSKE